jgi:hypothetical protein
LEYVQQIELAHFIADYSLEWFGEGLTVWVTHICL